MLHRHPLLSLASGAYLLFVGWLTLTPQPIDADHQDLILRALDALHRRGYAESIDYTRLEFLANIALFVPIGVFLLLLFGAGGWWVAAIGSFAMTAIIETMQRQIPGRVPDDRDLVANSVGALIGIAIALVLTLPATLRRRRRRQHARAQAVRRPIQHQP
ncbi:MULTISPECIES: VanZ family protein [Nocardioides]|uniref:VanZ family protein n=1 Tax=Nocardioides vastitatis TaxID=2568655 RepID=A0ABW0ZIB1_9ACTN|nr:VanZ family protein [Nocardioides sp.]THI98337.1 VanZ family protein [Nocardioides sp.]